MFAKDKIVNPATKEKCLNNSKNPEENPEEKPKVRLFKDDDYVYYYYVDLSGNNTSCHISDENAIITNIPKKLCSALKAVESEGIKCEE